MRAKQAMADLKKTLAELYEPREAITISEWVMEDITGKSRMDRIIRDDELLPEQEEKWNSYAEQLVTGKPLQYVLGYAWFMGERFVVNEHVLIPRPETEELVQWLISQVPANSSVMDIGTGSGCIPVLIKLRIPDTRVISVDISAEAIKVAQENAIYLQADVQFFQGDFLSQLFRDQLPTSDIIISNPPYIPMKDSGTMHRNVVNFEPHQALFVPDEDALVFYDHIIAFGKERGIKQLFFETHYKLAESVAEKGRKSGFSAEIRKDLAGHERMVKLVSGH